MAASLTRVVAPVMNSFFCEVKLQSKLPKCLKCSHTKHKLIKHDSILRCHSLTWQLQVHKHTKTAWTSGKHIHTLHSCDIRNEHVLKTLNIFDAHYLKHTIRSSYVLSCHCHRHINTAWGHSSGKLLRWKSEVLNQNKTNKESEESGTLSQKENIYTIPNLLTLGRMLSAPFLGYMVMNEQFVWAVGLFAFAGVSDLLDGYIARNFKNQNSVLGSALDPLADKILVVTLTLSLTCVNLIPVPLTALIVSRDVALVAASFYLRYISLAPPWNTACQLSLVALSLAAPVFNFVDHPLLQGLWYVTGATTFLSGIQYIFYWKDSVKMIDNNQKKG